MDHFLLLILAKLRSSCRWVTCSAVGPEVLVFSSQMGRGIHHENGHGTENEWSTGGEEHLFKPNHLFASLPCAVCRY